MDTKPYTLVFATDNGYVPYLYVALLSIKRHISQKNTYCVFILHADISQDNMRLISGLSQENFSISFIHSTSFLSTMDASFFYLPSYQTLATYYRLFIPKLFPDCKKVLYLDCDTIILCDVAEIIDLDMGNAMMLAVRDYGMTLRYTRKEEIFHYVHDILHISIEEYFQAGVLLCHIPSMEEKHFFSRCVEFISHNTKLPFADQDILNFAAGGMVTLLPPEYNVLWHLPILEKNLEANLGADFPAYKASCQHPKIIHYASWCKPWIFPELPLAEYFWMYAEQSPFYHFFSAEKQKQRAMLKRTASCYPFFYALREVTGKLAALLPFACIKKTHTKLTKNCLAARRYKRILPLLEKNF